MLKALYEWAGRWLTRSLTLAILVAGFLAFLRMVWQLADWVADTLIISGLITLALQLTAQAVSGLREVRRG